MSRKKGEGRLWGKGGAGCLLSASNKLKVWCEKGWCDELNDSLYFSHGKTNSGGVAIGCVGSKSSVLANRTTDKNGRLLLIESIVDEVKFVLINIYNCKTESQQLLTLTELHKILQNVDDIRNKNIIIGGDFNFHFNS